MGQLRIIGGQWKRTPIPVGHAPGLRPTPDRVRETLFNWLGQRLDGKRCLDLFAGSGALGFEAGSRGAASVTFIDQDPGSCRRIDELIAKLGAQDRLRCLRASGCDWISRQSPSFDVIFLDPPYASGLLAKALPLAAKALAPDGAIYLESDRPFRPEEAALAGLAIMRADKAGTVHYHLLQHSAGKGEQDAASGIPGDLRPPDAGP
jgi:16S rRNA (guanine(966)-N(2))-methyltransferase RsmD